MSRTKKEKPPTRVVRMQFDLDLFDALELIREDLRRGDVADTIRVLLHWAAWAHSCGRDPFQEMMAGEEHGCADWDIRIRAKREARELEKLFRQEGSNLCE
jgi:hypothetical protein